MNAKITHVPLAVRDQDAAIDYYTNKVGFVKRADFRGPTGARWVTVAPEGSDVELALVPAKLEARVEGDSKRGTNGLQVAFSTTDCRGDYEAMKARGVLFDIPGFETPQRNPWGTTAYFRDPDGNPFAMIQMSWVGRMMVAAFSRRGK